MPHACVDRQSAILCLHCFFVHVQSQLFTSDVEIVYYNAQFLPCMPHVAYSVPILVVPYNNVVL